MQNDPREIAKVLTKAQREALPKSGWTVRYAKRASRPLFIKTRGANFGAAWLGPLHIVWPMPWLVRSARALHPELFR